MTAIEETFGTDTERPVVEGYTVYGGNIADFEAKITLYSQIFLGNWEDAQHSNVIEVAKFKNKDGEYGFTATQMDAHAFHPFTGLSANWTEFFAGHSDSFYCCKIGDNVYFYVKAAYGYVFREEYYGGTDIPDSQMIFTDAPFFAAMSSVTVNAELVYTSGYTDGHASGVTDGIAEQKAKLGSISIYSNGTFTRPDGYSAITVNITSSIDNCQIGIGFYGPTHFHIGDDRDKWDRSDSHTKLSYYIDKIVVPEFGHNHSFDSWTEPDSYNVTFGEGYHTVWLELNDDLPTSYDWISVKSGSTYNTINIIKADNDCEWENCYPNNTEGTGIDFYNPSTDVEQLLMNLYKY